MKRTFERLLNIFQTSFFKFLLKSGFCNLCEKILQLVRKATTALTTQQRPKAAMSSATTVAPTGVSNRIERRIPKKRRLHYCHGYHYEYCCTYRSQIPGTLQQRLTYRAVFPRTIMSGTVSRIECRKKHNNKDGSNNYPYGSDFE